MPTSDRPLPAPAVLRRMVASIDYRGPDGVGEYLGADVHLGAVRLAIIDPKEGEQPVFGCDSKVVSVYNGELYNHFELRQSLRAKGHRLRSACDTEVLPHLYEEMGSKFVSQLRGMFGFALWDGHEKSLLLARDRMGIKPLFYAQTEDFLVFASEIKAIIASGLVEPEIDHSSVDDLFSLSYPCPPRTMFKGIFEVLPGRVVVASARTANRRETRYWESSIPPNGEHIDISKERAEEELRSLIDQRVYDHMIADVPVAAYLSGGLDSSVISAAMKRVTGDAPETFSISFDSPSHDEYEYAQQMAAHIEAPNNVLRCGDDIAEDLEAMIWHMELPLQFPLALPLMKLASAARSRGFPVVMTGEGADELMGGYDCFRADKMRRILDRPGLRFLRGPVYRQLYKWHKMPDGTLDAMLDSQSRASEIRRKFGGHVPPWYDMWTTVGVERNQLLSTGDRHVRPVDEPPEGFLELLPADFDRMHPLDAGIALEQATRLPSWILPIGDRSSMSASVEARVPFLDHTIVDFFASLPPEMKMKGFREKAILRSSTRAWLPRAIASRQKRPFFTPIREWFFGSAAPDFVRDNMSPESLRSAGIFDEAVVTRLLREVRLAPENHLVRSRLEWTLILVLGTQILHRYFVEKRCAAPPEVSI